MRARLEYALGLIGRDAGRLARALELARAEAMAETAEELARGAYRTTPSECRAWWWLRPDGARIRL